MDQVYPHDDIPFPTALVNFLWDFLGVSPFLFSLRAKGVNLGLPLGGLNSRHIY